MSDDNGGGSPYQFPAVHKLFNVLTSLEVHAERVAEALERCWSHQDAVPLPDGFSYRRLRQETNRDVALARDADRARAAEIDPAATEIFDRYHRRLSDLRMIVEDARRAADTAAPAIDDDVPAPKRLSIRIRNMVGAIGSTVAREHHHTEWDSPLMQSRETPERLRKHIPKLRKLQETIRQAAMAKVPIPPSRVHVTNPLLSLEPPPQPKEIVNLRKALALAHSLSEELVVLVRRGSELWEADGPPEDLDWPQYEAVRAKKIAGMVEAARQQMVANGEDPLSLSDQVTWSSWAPLLNDYAPAYQHWSKAADEAMRAARACLAIARPNSPVDQQWVMGLIGELRALLQMAGPDTWRSDGLRVFQSEPPDLGATLKPALDAIGTRLNLLVDLPFEIAEERVQVNVPPTRVLDFLAHLYDGEAEGRDKHFPIHQLPEDWRDPDFLLYCQDEGWVSFEAPYSAAIGTANGIIGYSQSWVFAGQALNLSTLNAIRKDLTDPHPKHRVFARLLLDGRRAVTADRVQRATNPGASAGLHELKKLPSDEASESLPDLADTEKFTLLALRKGGHTGNDTRIKLDELAPKAGYGTSASGTFKTVMANLGRRSLVQSKTGRKGGVWLSAEGVRVATILAGKTVLKQS